MAFEIFRDLLVNSAPSTISSLIVNPIQIIVSNRQLYGANGMNYRDVYHGIRNRGIKAAFLGTHSNILIGTGFYSMYFTIYQRLRSRYNVEIASYTAYFVSSFVLNPLYVLRSLIHTSIGRSDISPSISQFLTMIREDPRILFKGYGITAIKSIELYLQMKSMEMLDGQIPVGVSSFIIKMITTGATYPLEVIRIHRRCTRKSLRDIIYELIRTKSLYNGLAGNMIRSSLNAAIVFSLFKFIH